MVERISSLFDVAAILGESEQITTAVKNSQQSLVGLFDTINKFKGSNITDLAQNAEKLNGSIQGTVKANRDLTSAQKELNAEIAKRTKLASDEGRAIAISKDQTKQLAAEVRQAAQLANSAADTYKGLVQQYENAARAAKDLAVSQGTGSQAAIDAAAKAKLLSDKLKEIDSTVGQNQRKVGDYTGALKILEQRLATVQANMTTLSSAGQGNSEAYAKAAEEAGLLTVIVNQQEKGFNSVTQQIRATERALFTLKEAGFGAGETFDKIRESTIEAAQSQKEFLRQEKLLESEAPLLGALALAAKGLAGAYAVGAGSVALFADGNEKVEKELNKLVAIMTILQGLHEAYELIQQAGSIGLAIRTALTKAANAVIGENAAITEAATITNVELAASEEVVTVATEGETAAMGELAVAAEGATVGVEAAAVATSEFGTALLATGIGAAIATIAVAILYLISKIPDWIKGNHLALKQQEELSEAMHKANEAMIEQVRFMSDLDQATKKYYQNQLALSSAAGLNEEKTFAISKALGKEELRLAEDEVNALGASYTGNARLAEVIQDLNNKKQAAIDIQLKLLAIPEQKQTSDQKDQLEAAKKNEEFYKKAAEAPKSLYEASKKALEERDAAVQKSAQDEYKEAKFTADERRKILLESVKVETDLIKARNSTVLSNDNSTQEQRLAAMKSNANQERRIIESQRQDVINNAGSSEADIKIANDRAKEQQKQLTIESAEARRQLNEEYAKREADAQMAILKSSLTERAKVEEDYATDEKNPLSSRIIAFDDAMKKQMELLRLEADFEKSLAGKTATEKFQIEVEYQNKVTDLMQAAEKRRLALILKGIEEQSAMTGGKTSLDNTKDQTKQLEALNKQFKDGAISIEKYNSKKADINDKAALDGLKQENELLKFQRGELANAGADKKKLQDLDIQIANNDRTIAETEDKKAMRRAKEKEKLKGLEIKAAEEVGHAIVSFVDGAYEKQLNAIQKKIDLNNIEHEKETKAISESSLSNQEKAAQQIMLDAKINAQNQALQRQQRDIKIREAKFDRDVAVAKVIEEGAVAAVKALDLPPPFGEAEAIAIGIITAAQVASILARPIPTYGFGTQDHPGGPAWTGDRFAPELIQEPGRLPFMSPAVPTLMDLKPHTKVIPLEDIERMTKGAMQVNRFGQLEARENSDMRELKEAIQWQTGRIERALAKNRPVTHVHVSNFWTQIKDDI